jgi:ABC-type polysaccharide/polyol phosphate transport system ATPase subunit
MDTAIRAEELSKVYRLYARPVDRFLELFTARPRYRVFPALQDVSFEIRRGETVGLIGHNGAGKSTLLKLLCGVTAPSAGTLSARGSIASILELGTGFHPEFTGRDNAALNAAILGLSAAEVKTALPAILDFSELGPFLDQPVKTYSSGMYMRLAFSVAVNVEPEILVIDEALAVGDGYFQKKCIDKIREFQRKGRTIVFCSHALYYISNLCERTIWLDHGTMRRLGPSIDVVHEYENYLLEQERKAPPEAPVEETAQPVRIRELQILDARGNPPADFETGDEIVVRMVIESLDPDQPIHILAGVNRAADQMQCFAFGTVPDGVAPLRGRSLYEVRARLRDVPLVRGEYELVVYVGDENALHVFDRRDLRPAFTIAGDRYEIGLMAVDHEWEINGRTIAARPVIVTEALHAE